MISSHSFTPSASPHTDRWAVGMNHISYSSSGHTHTVPIIIQGSFNILFSTQGKSLSQPHSIKMNKLSKVLVLCTVFIALYACTWHIRNVP